MLSRSRKLKGRITGYMVQTISAKSDPNIQGLAWKSLYPQGRIYFLLPWLRSCAFSHMNSTAVFTQHGYGHATPGRQECADTRPATVDFLLLQFEPYGMNQMPGSPVGNLLQDRTLPASGIPFQDFKSKLEKIPAIAGCDSMFEPGVIHNTFHLCPWIKTGIRNPFEQQVSH